MRVVAFGFLCLMLGLGNLTRLEANEVKLPSDLSQVGFVKVSKRIYILHGLQEMPDPENKGLISNTGIVLTESGVVVVDSGGSYEIGRLIVERIKKLTDKPIIAVFNSHIHGDHWLGNSAIREAFPEVRIYAHRKAIERLNAGEAKHWRDIIQGMVGKKMGGSIKSFLPDAALEGGEELTFGGEHLRIHHPGHAHTDSDIMVEALEQRLLFTGDVVEYGRAVSSDVPEDFDARGQIAAIRYMLKLPVDIYVPGHGKTGGREIPLAALRFLDILYSSVKKNYHAGLKDYEMKEKVVADLHDFHDWFNFGEIGRMISFVYQQVENEDFN